MLCRIAGVIALATLTACTAEIGQSGKPRAPEVDPLLALESGVRRLTQAELDNTLRDLLGEESAPAARLLNEDEFRPFDNDYTIQQASEALITSLDALAEEVAARALGDSSKRAALVPCTPSGDADEACFREFLKAYLPRVFRRPLSSEDLDAYLPLLQFASEDNAAVENDFYTAVELTVAASIQDPEFLYRVEEGAPGGTPGLLELDDYEIANRMSYLLWASMPDDALRDAAATGSLRSPEGRRAEGLRMLEDPKARGQLHRFHAMWLGYRSIPHDAELVAAFNRETSALIDRVVLDEPGSYLRLFTMDETYVDDALADHYGLPRPADGEGWVSYEGTDRAGILGHGSLLAAFSKFEDTSPTQRGILVRTRFMCEDVPRPPPNVDADQPPQGAMDAVCKYERYAEHRDQSSSCAGCHSLVDPIGFGLENYDIAGRYREHDDGLPDCVIEGTGAIVGIGDFAGPAQLSQLLVENDYVDACAVKQFLTFALGRPTSSYETAMVDEAIDSFRSGRHDFKAFIMDFIASERFARRAEERL